MLQMTMNKLLGVFKNSELLKCSLLLCLLICFNSQATLAQEIVVPGNFYDETIYSVIVSRFYDGDPSNNFYNYERIEKGDPHYRGDFKGLAKRLDYIKELGFTAICITPPVENRGGLDFMGFNAYDWLSFEPRLKSENFGFKDLVAAAKSKGLKVIMTMVVNHSSNYGIRNEFFIPRLPLKFYRGDKTPDLPYYIHFGNYTHPYRMDNDNPLAPGWFRDLRYRDKWGAGPLVDQVTGATFPSFNKHPERFFGTDESTLDTNLYNTEGWLDPSEVLFPERVQRAHLDENSIALATLNLRVRDYFSRAMRRYVAHGIDGVRIQFARNTDRRDLLYMVERWRKMNPDLYIIADVAPVLSGFGQTAGCEEPSELVPWWYTRTTLDPSEPFMGHSSGITVMDYPLFKAFSESIALGHFNGIGNIIANDWLYSDANSVVTFFHNYDIGPEEGHLTRFSQETWKAANAYNLMWTIRGVPMLLMGEEIEFQRGMPQVFVLPEDRLSQTGKAYFGKHLTDDRIEETMNHPLFLHIKHLSAIRSAIPALSRGRLENGDEFVSGISFTRNYNNQQSYAVVGLSAFIDQQITVDNVPAGTYRDAVTGESLTVATDTRSISFDVKANSAGIWVLDGPGKIGTGSQFLH